LDFCGDWSADRSSGNSFRHSYIKVRYDGA
jgi:hypothetical protein